MTFLLSLPTNSLRFPPTHAYVVCYDKHKGMLHEIRTSSAKETKAWGARLAQLLFPGAVIGLEGDLGAGKTCFVKGLARGLGIDEDEITSPTFTLIAEHYRGKIPLYHI